VGGRGWEGVSISIDELKPVTALFADIVGSTALGERLTPGDVKALIGECVSRMSRAVETRWPARRVCIPHMRRRSIARTGPDLRDPSPTNSGLIAPLIPANMHGGTPFPIG
jgi:hypothetical protein